MRAIVHTPLLFALFVGLGGPAPAAKGLEAGESAAVARVVDGDTVVLDRAIGTAMEVRLVGIQAPKLPLGRPNFPIWPLAGESKRALERLVLGRRVTLSFGGRRVDRHGRLLAHLHAAGGAWIQGEMLRLGLARVYGFADNRALIPEMLALERQARAAGRGIWGHPFYAIRTPARTNRDIGTFQIVEGTVVAAARVKGRIYLNFGADWRTDFTVTIGSKAQKLFRQAGVDPLALEGRRLRVRGWLKRFNGPLIEATHPGQIEAPAE
jgi:endonuclease YncB( thermonuclease family)